jgi:GxxExxY protein
MEPPMDADERRLAIDAKTERIIGAAYRVSNLLGAGFLEKVYENALTHELRKRGFRVDQQCRIDVHYDGVVVGQYAADLVVDGELLIEIKAIKAFDEIHTAQCLNYLKATGLNICLLINFGSPKVAVKRIVHQL